MSPRKLREECLPNDGRNTLVRAIVNGQVVGHVCACRWNIARANYVNLESNTPAFSPRGESLVPETDNVQPETEEAHSKGNGLYSATEHSDKKRFANPAEAPRMTLKVNTTQPILLESQNKGRIFDARQRFARRTIARQEQDNDFPLDQICWVTQLVVRSDLRRQGIATTMLRELRDHEKGSTTCFGILSSHPAAILAFTKVFADRPDESMLSRLAEERVGIREHPRKVVLEDLHMAVSPVPYVRRAAFEMALDGFADERAFGGVLIGSANTNFYVDHAEPKEALDELQRRGRRWPFGELPEGSEYLVVAMKFGHRHRSSSTSVSCD